MQIFKDVMLVLLGMIIAVGLFCLIVAIGCGVNGVSFGQQIVNWFGTTAPAIKEPVEEVVETIATLPIA